MKMHLAALCLFTACAPAAALAQVGPSIGGGQGYGGQGYGGSGLSRAPTGAKTADDDSGGKPPADKPVAPPPAIPGAQPNADTAVIPADKVAAEMSPNDALFDAITRGDLAAAKDALNRGAQLEAHNVLGQTPTDAAIDLSRNDITFLLLSMRTSVPSAHAVVQTAAAPAPHAKGGHAKVVRTAARAVPADRGTPNPAVGFTGF